MYRLYKLEYVGWPLDHTSWSINLFYPQPIVSCVMVPGDSAFAQGILSIAAVISCLSSDDIGLPLGGGVLHLYIFLRYLVYITLYIPGLQKSDSLYRH